MQKLDLTKIEQKLSEQEYKDHITRLEADPSGSEQRFLAWINSYHDSLMGEYIRRLKSSDNFSMTHSFTDWSRQQFIIFDCNRVTDRNIADYNRKIADEINAMLGVQ